MIVALVLLHPRDRQNVSKQHMTGLGIGSIIGLCFCGIGYILTLIFGWQNKFRHGDYQKFMPIYTGALILRLSPLRCWLRNSNSKDD